MSENNQRMNKVSAYFGFNGALAFGFGVLANPVALVLPAVALGAVAIFRPKWIPEIKKQFVKFAKDVGSHIGEDVKRTGNWLSRKFGNKEKAKRTVASAKATVSETASEFKATVQKKTFNKTAKPQTKATTTQKKKPAPKTAPTPKK